MPLFIRESIKQDSTSMITHVCYCVVAFEVGRRRLLLDWHCQQRYTKCSHHEKSDDDDDEVGRTKYFRQNTYSLFQCVAPDYATTGATVARVVAQEKTSQNGYILKCAQTGSLHLIDLQQGTCVFLLVKLSNKIVKYDHVYLLLCCLCTHTYSYMNIHIYIYIYIYICMTVILTFPTGSLQTSMGRGYQYTYA